MEITFDDNGNKFIKIPPLLTFENAEPYKYLHTKTLYDLDETEELADIKVGTYEGIRYLILVYKDPIKPNIIFKFSRELTDRMNNGESHEFLYSCQFFYWKDENSKGHIRFARPIELRNLKSLI